MRSIHLFHVDQLFYGLKDENERLVGENRKLAQQVAELTATLRESARTAAANAPPPLPPFVKPKKPARRRRKTPGRKAGHPAALRPVPEQIDVHPLP